MSDNHSLSSDAEARVQAMANQIYDEHKHKLDDEDEFEPSDELKEKMQEAESEEEAKEEAEDEVDIYAEEVREKFAGYFETSADQKRADADPPLSDEEDARLMELLEVLLDDVPGEMLNRAYEVVVQIYLDSEKVTDAED